LQFWGEGADRESIGSRGGRRAGDTGAGAVEKEPHPQGFGTLDGYQAHMAADVIGVFKIFDPGFIVGGIPLQARNSCFDHGAKAGADLVGIVGSAVIGHGWHLLIWEIEADKKVCGPQAFPSCADSSEESNFGPDYGFAH
jgi:hypothetical protein